MKRIGMAVIVVAFGLLGAMHSAGQGLSTSSPITIVVPFAAGGAQDVIARYMGQQLSQKLNTPVVIENKAGAGGVIAANFVAKSSPDGKTIFLASGAA